MSMMSAARTDTRMVRSDVTPHPWRDDLVFDHAFVLVEDVNEAARRLRSDFGLGSVVVGPFPEAPGLANRIVPMREGFLELLGLEDRRGSDAAAFWHERLELQGEHFAGWAMRTQRLDQAATELGLEVQGPERQIWVGDEDHELRWSVVWPYEDPASVPFLIEWEDFKTLRRLLDHALEEANHHVEPLGVHKLAIGGDQNRVRDRIGVNSLVRAVTGPERVIAITIATAQGSIDLRWEGSAPT
jgi:Glyoxalase-like domain